MNCPICGAENAPETKFCVGCGSALTDAAPAAPASEVYSDAPVSEAKAGFPISKKTIIFGAVGILAVVLVIVLLSALFSGNGFITVEQYPELYEIEEGEYAIVVGKKALKTTIKSEDYPDTSYSLDYSDMSIVTSEGELYVVTGKKVKQIKDADDVVYATMSNNGKSVAYVSKGEDDENATLYLAKVSNGKSTEITDELAETGSYYYSSYSIKISPDGKSVAYFKDGGEDPDALMYFKGKKSVEICDDEYVTLHGLSNGGKQIYVSITDDEGKTNLYSFNSKAKKTKLGGYSGSVSFNKDHTQVLFVDDDGKSVISTNGKEGKKVRKGSLYMITPANVASKGSTYPVSNLYGQVYSNGDGDIYMIKKNKDIKLAGKTSDVMMDASGKYLYYIHDNDELKVLKISNGDKASDKAKVIVDENVDGYIVTSDRKYVYFWDDGDTLMAVNGKRGGTPKEITDELEAYEFGLSSKDVFYYIVDGDLYAVSNGKKGKKVQGDVESVSCIPYGSVYAEGDGKLYGTTGSKKLKQILEFED